MPLVYSVFQSSAIGIPILLRLQIIALARKVGGLDISLGERNPEDALNIAQENQQLKKKTNAMEKEIKRLNEMNEFLEDAAAFFAASRQKSGKSKD